MLINDFSDSQVTVNKKELLAKLSANRAEHKRVLDMAMVGYRKKMCEQLGKMLEQAHQLDGKLIRTVTCVQPEDHLEEFDDVIAMLTMSTADEITISGTQFKQFVLNRWNWQKTFQASTLGYIGG